MSNGLCAYCPEPAALKEQAGEGVGCMRYSTVLTVLTALLLMSGGGGGVGFGQL